jgi:DNA-directed RNA polymerase specialized sigma subunit
MGVGIKSKGYARKPDPDDPNDTGEDTVGAISAQNPAKYAEVMQSLTRNQREVFALYFGDGIIVNERLTMAEVARRIGAKANASTISQTIQRIKNKFRNAGLPMPLRTTNWKPN